jgi:hypothetical protein
MLLEHGSEAVFFGLGEIAKQERLEEEGQPEEGKYAKQTKKKTKTQIRKNKKMLRIAKAEALAEKIKAKHAIDVDPTEFTLSALEKMLRTGEMQEKRKKKGKNGYMRFLTQERVENKKRAEPIPSNEFVKLVGQKWREMTDEQKAAWKTEEPKKVTEEPKKVTEEPKKATEEPKKATEEPKKATEEPKKVTEEPKKATEEPKKATEEPKEPKMKKGELKIHLTEKYGWDAKLLCKFTVSELRQAMETGELPTEAMEKRKSQSKKPKKVKNAKVAEPEAVAVAEAEPEPEPQTTGGNLPSMFDMSDTENDDDSDDEDESN